MSPDPNSIDSGAPVLDEEPPTRPGQLQDAERRRPFLTVLVGADAGESHWLGPDGVVIGRSRQASLCIPDDTVSRKHAQIAYDGSKFMVKDLGSANGTFVNGNRIVEQPLKDGDKLALGSHVVMRFNLAEERGSSGESEGGTGRDPATGALSARQTEAHLVTERGRAERANQSLTLLFVRVDAYAQLLARQGRPAAEAVLAQVAKLLTAQTRKEDVVGRQAEETFCVVMRELSLAQAKVLAERIMYRLDQLRPFQGAVGTLATLAPIDATVAACPTVGQVYSAGLAALQQGEARKENSVLKALDLG